MHWTEKNYLKRTTEGRNKRLVTKTEKILNNNRTKAITDADIQKQIAKQNEIKNKVGRPRKTSQIIDNTSDTIWIIFLVVYHFNAYL